MPASLDFQHGPNANGPHVNPKPSVEVNTSKALSFLDWTTIESLDFYLQASIVGLLSVYRVNQFHSLLLSIY